MLCHKEKIVPEFQPLDILHWVVKNAFLFIGKCGKYPMPMQQDPFNQIVVELLGRVSGKSREELEPFLETPPQLEKGDRCIPCFRWAKSESLSPNALAEKWKDAILREGLPPEIENVESVGGYLNFFLTSDLLAEYVLKSIHQNPSTYGFSTMDHPKRVIVEFSSPNIAKPFSIGHLRSTNIGASLARIFAARGFEVIRINHLGDWGTQFGKLISAYRRWGNAEMLEDHPIQNLYKLYVKWHQEESSDPTLIEEAREWFSKLEKGDDEAKELWQWFRDLTLRELKTLYDRLNVEFDYYWGESFYSEAIPSILKELDSRGLSKRSDDATIIDLEEYSLAKCVIQKSDESTLYLTRDLAAAVYRHQKLDFDQMIYVVGSPQRLHFQQLFKILELLGHSWAPRCEHVAFGHISFGDEAMSTRKGNVVFLSDVMDRLTELAEKVVLEKNPTIANRETVSQQVALGAILFADLSAKRIKDIRFSWEDILSFEGETGPYLQYSYVRTQSILRKFEGTIEQNVDVQKLSSKEEKLLIRKLSQFPDALGRAERDREPFLVAQYLIELSREFNRFYTKHRILDEDRITTQSRILLTYCLSSVLKTGLGLLGIPTPAEM